MTRLVVTGLNASAGQRLAVEACGGGLTVTTASDFDGAVALAQRDVDFYVGICQSGAGAAIAMAIGLVGSNRARNVADLGAPLEASAVRAAIDEGVVAFGVPLEAMDAAIPLIAQTVADPDSGERASP